jgi:hypothetical protein
MTDMPAAAGSGRAPSGTEPGLIRRHELVAALDRAAQKRSRLSRRLPAPEDVLFWLTMLGEVRAAAYPGFPPMCPSCCCRLTVPWCFTWR